jgi:hypothetical protein
MNRTNGRRRRARLPPRRWGDEIPTRPLHTKASDAFRRARLQLSESLLKALHL